MPFPSQSFAVEPLTEAHLVGSERVEAMFARPPRLQAGVLYRGYHRISDELNLHRCLMSILIFPRSGIDRLGGFDLGYRGLVGMLLRRHLPGAAVVVPMQKVKPGLVLIFFIGPGVGYLQGVPYGAISPRFAGRI